MLFSSSGLTMGSTLFAPNDTHLIRFVPYTSSGSRCSLYYSISFEFATVAGNMDGPAEEVSAVHVLNISAISQAGTLLLTFLCYDHHSLIAGFNEQ